MRELWRTLLRIVMPDACAACAQDLAMPAPMGLCRVCFTALVRVDPAGCRRCGAPLRPDGRCLAPHRDLQNLEFLVAPFGYAGTGGALVRRFKLDADAAAGRLLAAAMGRHLRERLPPPWRHALLVPVPLHPQKRRQRGFDQAAWLARQIASRCAGLRVQEVLRRTRNTAPQGDPRTTNRERNVHGAFSLRRGGVAGARLVLVDDVATSAATLRACAGVLRNAGALAIGAVVGCRATAQGT